MERIAITGTSGFLGSRASNFLRNNYSVVDITRSILDITNEKEVESFLTKTRPKYVIHSAAISNIEVAAQNPEMSDVTNRLSPYYIAKACKKIDAKLVYMSSDQVYTGNKERVALVEDVQLNPQNLYAQQKLEAEKLIMEELASAVCLRLTWMYDTPESQFFQHKALPAQLIEASKTGTTYKVNRNQLRSVTYINDVIENLPACLTLPGGIYNYGSENDLPIVDLIKNIACVLGITEGIVEPYDGLKQNILINTSKIKKHRILFPTAYEGFKKAFKNYKHT